MTDQSPEYPVDPQALLEAEEPALRALYGDRWEEVRRSQQRQALAQALAVSERTIVSMERENANQRREVLKIGLDRVRRVAIEVSLIAALALLWVAGVLGLVWLSRVAL